MEKDLEILTELEKYKADAVGTRNTRIADLVEGDIIVDGDDIQHVANGDVSIFSNGTIDDSLGELAPVDAEAIGYAIAAGNTIFNMEDI